MSTTASVRRARMSRLDAFFGITARGSTVMREFLGGLTMFLVSAYIVVVNPAILSFAGVEGLAGLGPGFAPTMAMTCLVAGLCSLAMGLYAKYPILMAPGMGLNAVVAFSLVAGLGLTWQEAMGIILMEGVLIMVLVLTGLREAVMDAIPVRIKQSIAVGIGLFIMLIGLVNGGLVVLGVPGAPLALGDFTSPTALVLLVGLALTFALELWRLRGAMLVAILLTTVFAIAVNAMTGGAAYASLPGVAVLPTALFAWPDMSSLGAGLNLGAFAKIGVLGTLLAVFSLAMADFFDTMGTVVAIGEQGNMLDDEHRYPKGDLKRILVVDSLGPILGGFAGSSSATSYIESGSGVAAGARTGLAAVVAGVLFLACMVFSPLAMVIPAQATAPALVLVGFLMFSSNMPGILSGWEDMSTVDRLTEGLPAFLTVTLMAFTYSITAGIGAGFIVYTALQLVRGRIPHPLMILSSLAFCAYFLLR
jgi:AGZA family xanthine/uracil permease-like MFS transporter